MIGVVGDESNVIVIVVRTSRLVLKSIGRIRPVLYS